MGSLGAVAKALFRLNRPRPRLGWESLYLSAASLCPALPCLSRGRGGAAVWGPGQEGRKSRGRGALSAPPSHRARRL
ncbi:hypothetical protein NDU88_003513 [Pleurodeles waltl]|uniref:Uncharacterized protein n=1 Tax=Pleurodeles waltl TaxID=8319 RepID=A0AAV7T6W2_PLEWA|nr:hypothetical protein NDU88_003513 [Pleurodeles waltl]